MIGSDLFIGNGEPERLLPSLMDELQLTPVAVHFQDEICTEERAIEKAVRKALNVPDRCIYRHGSSPLYEVDHCPLKAEDTHEVFTHFRVYVENRAQPNKPLAAPGRGSLPLPPRFHCGLHPLPPLPELPKPNPDAIEPHYQRFYGGETAALQRVQEYFFRQDKLQYYKQTRDNFMGVNNSSKFSPYLALGCVSPRKIYELIQKYERERVKNESTYWLFFELLWRDYFKYYFMKHGARPFTLHGVAGNANAKWDRDMGKFIAYMEGKTGYPLIDALMREMATTGSMSNRGRQCVASFLIHELGLDWRMGAEYMESALVDYDPCANWGNWHALMGGQGGRINRFNIVRQATQHDPNGEFIRLWVPELRKLPVPHLYAPHKAPKEILREADVVLGITYPRPIRTNEYAHFTRDKRGGGHKGKGASKRQTKLDPKMFRKQNKGH